MTVENVPPPTTYLQSSAFEINEYCLINIITSISMNRGTESRAWKWKCSCEKNRWGPFSMVVENVPPPPPGGLLCLDMGRGVCSKSRAFEINEYYLINISITNISMNRNLLNGNKEMNRQICMLF